MFRCYPGIHAWTQPHSITESNHRVVYLQQWIFSRDVIRYSHGAVQNRIKGLITEEKLVTRCWKIGFAAVLLQAITAMSAIPAAAAPDGAPDREGAGTSYWGEIPERSADNTTKATDEDRPGWEYVADAPLYIGLLPLRWTLIGFENMVGFLNENPLMQRILHFFPLHVGPAYLSGGISLGSQDGFGGNLALDFPDFLGAGNAMKIRGAASSKGAGKAVLGLKLYDGPGGMTQLGGGYRSDVRTFFYGFGPDSREARESLYREEMGWFGISHRRPIRTDNFWWEASALFSGVSATGSSETDDTHLSEEFADSLPPGYRIRSDGASVAIELRHDNTTQIGPPGFKWRERTRPERGGLRRARISWFQETTELDIAFWTWRAEIQQFIPLWFSRRGLALRGFVSRIENEGSEPVPFQRMLTNDDPDLFRGYNDYRFRDLGIGAVSAEYRWPVWALNRENGIGVDAYAFVDYGQVFSEFEDISNDRLTTSYGGGLRVGGFGKFAGRIEVGKSDEELIFRFRADQVFQYAKSGLFKGRNPVPER